MKTAILLSILLSILAVSVWGQEKTTQERARAVADLALAAPPELAADVLIKLAAIPDSGSRAQKIDWLERAFALAPGAKFPVKLVGAFGASGQTDSSVGAVHTALSAGLDTLSLRSRVIQAMLLLDRERAMGLFRAMGAFQLPVYGCKDAMVAEPSAYYDMIAAIYQRGFTDAERLERRDVELLRAVITGISSPVEFEPASRLLVLNPSLLEVLGFDVVVGVLERLRTDDRSYATTSRQLLSATARLAKDARERGLSPLGLVSAARGYLVRQLTGTRCAETETAQVTMTFGQNGPRMSTSERDVQLFNTTVLTGIASTDVRPIAAEEVKAAKAEGSAREVMWWTSASSQTMLMPLKHLRFGTEAQQAANSQLPRRADGRATFLSAEQRSTVEWETEVRDYLKALERWRSEHEEGEAEFFHMSGMNYETLTELIPSRTLRATVLRSYVTFLGQSEMRRTSPPEWFSHANRLIQYPPAETEAEKAWIREEVRASGDPTLAVYLDLWEITPRK